MWRMWCNEEKKEMEPMRGLVLPFFLVGAFVSMMASLILQLKGKKNESLFVGQWVPSLLLLGIYKRWILRHWMQRRS